MCLCACVNCVCACVFVLACLCQCMCVCVHIWVYVGWGGMGGFGFALAGIRTQLSVQLTGEYFLLPLGFGGEGVAKGGGGITLMLRVDFSRYQFRCSPSVPVRDFPRCSPRLVWHLQPARHHLRSADR